MGNYGVHKSTGRGVWIGLTQSIGCFFNGSNKRWPSRRRSHMQRICDKWRTDKHRVYMNVRMFWEPEADSISSWHHIPFLTQGTIALCARFEISLTPQSSGAESWSRTAAFWPSGIVPQQAGWFEARLKKMGVCLDLNSIHCMQALAYIWKRLCLNRF